MNAFDLILNRSKSKPETIAIRTIKQDITYLHFVNLISQAAAYLGEKDIKPGKIVAVSIEDELTLLTACLAVMRLGATVFCVPHHYPDAQKRNMVEYANTSLLVTPTEKNVNFCSLKNIPFSLQRLQASSDIIGSCETVNSLISPAIIAYGSGSTGKPKLMPFSHQLLALRAQRISQSISFTSKDCLASNIHLNFLTSLVRALGTLAAGGTLALLDRSRLLDISILKGLKVNFLQSTVLHAEGYLKQAPVDASGALDFLRCLSIGASTVTDDLRKQITSRLTKNLYVTYGTNECGSISLACPQELFTVKDTVGKPLPDVIIEVVDANENPLPTGSLGELRIKTPAFIDGYMGDSQATVNAFRDGWFYPGDLGKFTEDGSLIHCGRSDHMMIMNGINIYPTEIESVMLSHNAIKDVSAFPLPHPTHQDIPVCAVVLHEGAAAVSEKSLQSFVQSKLGARGPKQVAIVNEIPRNDRGKIVRQQLLDSFHTALKIQRATKTEQTTLIFSQTHQPIRLKFTLPDNLNFTLADQWLVELLHLDISEIPQPSTQLSNSTVTAVSEFCKRFLALFRLVLQVSGIPQFDRPVPKHLKPDKPDSLDQWSITIYTTHIDHIPKECFSTALKLAISIVTWCMKNSVTHKNQASFYQALVEAGINPIRKLLSGGKSTFPVLKCAYDMDIPFLHLGSGIYQLGWGTNARWLERSTCEGDSAMGARIATKKHMTADRLRSAGLPAPTHAIIGNERQALQAAKKLGWPVVVKPNSLERGEGVTVDINSNEAVSSAVAKVRTLSHSQGGIIVERQVPGICHRVFIADGELLYVVKRMPKSVLGDGSSTIELLIDKANQDELLKPPWERTEAFPKDDLTEAALARQGYTLSSVPDAGHCISLRDIESTRWGGRDEDLTLSIHPENVRIALSAAKVLGLKTAGVDIISTDISQPWHTNGAIINEVNYSPLLGGGEISKRYIPAFLNRFVRNRGRIPIMILVGEEPDTERLKRFLTQINQGERSFFLTSHCSTLSSSGEEITMPFDNLFRRCKALLLHQEVAGIILHIQSDELLYTGLPVDRISRIIELNQKLFNSQSPREVLAPSRHETLLNFLKSLTAHERDNDLPLSSTQIAGTYRNA